MRTLFKELAALSNKATCLLTGPKQKISSNQLPPENGVLGLGKKGPSFLFREGTMSFASGAVNGDRTPIMWCVD